MSLAGCGRQASLVDMANELKPELGPAPQLVEHLDTASGEWGF